MLTGAVSSVSAGRAAGAAVAGAEPLAYPWFVVAMLLVAYALSFLDRQILTLMVDPIRASLGISDTQFSLLHGLAFVIFYTLLGLPFGRLADRASRRVLIALGIFGWSLATAACGLARNFVQLFVARVGVGVGEATLSPAAYSIIADYFPPERRSRALSIYAFGIALGAGLALIFGGQVVELATEAGPRTILGLGPFEPWQLVFLIVGLPGAVYAGLTLVIREPRRTGTLGRAGSVPLAEVMRFVADRRKLFFCFLLGTSLLAAVAHGAMAWLPAYFGRVHGWSPGQVGVRLGLVVLGCGSLGLLLGGLLAERLEARGHSDATVRAVLIGAWGCLPFGLVAPLVSSPWLSLALVAGFETFVMLPWGVASAAVQVVTPNELRGQLSAFYLFAINLIGLGLGPALVAMVSDRWFGGGVGVRFSIALAIGVIAPIAALIIGAGLRSFRAGVTAAQAWTR